MNPLRLLVGFENWAVNQGPGVSEKTARRYERIAGKFIEEVGDPRAAGRDEVERWFEKAHDGAAPSTTNLKIAAIRALFAYLRYTGMREDDPSQRVRMKKVPDRLPRPISHEDIKKVIAHIRQSPDPLARQDLAMVEALYGSGLRREEAATLRLRHIVDRGQMRIIGKGDKERVTIITEPEFFAIRDWVLFQAWGEEGLSPDKHERDADFWWITKNDPDRPLFYNVAGVPLTDLKDPGHYIYERWRRNAEAAGVKGTPHALRHSFGTELLNGGADLASVSMVMGHDDIRTTRVYTELQSRGLRALQNAHARNSDEESDGYS